MIMAARSPAERPLSKNFFRFLLPQPANFFVMSYATFEPPHSPHAAIATFSPAVSSGHIEYRTCQAPQGIPNQELEALSHFQFQSHFKFERFPLSLIHCEANWRQTKTPHGFHIQHHLYREGADCNGINLSAYCPRRL